MSIFDSILGSVFNDADDKGCDWYCDECNAYMNSQPGFSTSGGEWTCAECGCVNDVSEDNIIYDYDDYDEDDERISVWEAAEIWRSHGKDEDYMFGYTEEELEDA